MRTRRLWILAASMWIALVLCLSFLPLHSKRMLHTKGRLHSFGHLVAFGFTSLLLLRGAQTRKGYVLLLLLTFSLGPIIEIWQHLLFGARLELTDMLVDAGGVVLGALLAVVSGSSITNGNRD